MTQSKTRSRIKVIVEIIVKSQMLMSERKTLTHNLVFNVESRMV
jgi:hypothetical protein